jgi:hypothetical protein
MIQLNFLQKVKRWLDNGWHCGWTSQHDSYPTLEYLCPYCKKESAWVAGIHGFCGVAPKANCCEQRIPFPINDADFAKHLTANPKFHDGEEPRSPFVDTWDSGFDGKFGYEKSDPGGVR